MHISKKKYDADAVEMPVPEYNKFMGVLELAHALMGGTDAMRAMGPEYLPKEEAEEGDAYKARLKRSFLLNAFRRTIQKLAGEVFSQAIAVPEKMPPDMLEWLENIDLSNNDITGFGKELFEDGVIDGIVHVLVDLPEIETTVGKDGKIYYEDIPEGGGPSTLRMLTMEAMKQNGWRPYWVEITAENLIGWRTEKINGKKVPCQIRISEVSEEAEGTYGVKEVHRIRVINKDNWEVWILTHTEKKEDEWVLEKQGQHNRGYIPLVSWIIGEQVSEMTTEPPLSDLANLNLAHWQSASDQRNVLHYARMITYFAKMLGLDDKGKGMSQKAIFGANVLIHANNEAADLKVVEPTGRAIESGRNDLKDLEVQMRAYGLGMIMGTKSGTETATAKAIDTAESDSTLKSWAVSFEGFLNRCIAMSAKLVGIEDELEPVKVNTDFKSFLRSMEVRELREAFTDGLLPRELVIEELQRRGVIKDDIDFVDIMKMLDAEAEEQQKKFDQQMNNWRQTNPEGAAAGDAEDE